MHRKNKNIPYNYYCLGSIGNPAYAGYVYRLKSNKDENTALPTTYCPAHNLWVRATVGTRVKYLTKITIEKAKKIYPKARI